MSGSRNPWLVAPSFQARAEAEHRSRQGQPMGEEAAHLTAARKQRARQDGVKEKVLSFKGASLVAYFLQVIPTS